jgi:hypothetical protein
MSENIDQSQIQAGPISYQWQVSTDGGVTFTNLISSPNSPSLSLTNVSAIQNNYYYRAIASSGGLTIISDAAKLIALPTINITSQPTNQTSSNNTATFSFSVETTNGARNSYQWEFSLFNTPTQFNTIVGATGTSLSLSGLTEQDDGNLYRAKIVSKFNDTLPLTVYTNNAQLDYTISPITIIQQPKDLVLSDLSKPELFSVTATSNTELTYQWQESPDGTNFTNLPSTNNPTLYISAIEDVLNKNQYKYRVLISSNNYTITSSIATMHTSIELPIIDNAYNNTYLWGDPHLRIQSAKGPLANLDDNKYKDPIVYFYIKYENGDSYKAVYQNRFSTPSSASGPAAVNDLWMVKSNNQYTGIDPNSTQSTATPSTSLTLSNCTFAGVTGWDYLNGRCLSFSTTAGSSSLDNSNYSQLIKNSVKWLCRNKINPSILLMSSGNTIQDNKLKSKLETITTKTINVVVLSSFNNANNILDTTDVVLLQNNYNWNTQTLSDSAQTALKTFVSKGGGLLTTEWVLRNMSQGYFKILNDVVPVVPTSSYSTKSPIRYIKNIHDSVLSLNVSTDFSFTPQNISGTETAITQAKPGATIFYHSEQCIDNSGEKILSVGNVFDLIYKQSTWNNNPYYNIYTRWNKSISYTGKVKIGGALYWVFKSLIEYKKDPNNVKYAAWKSGLTGRNTDGYGLVMKPYGITRQMLTDAVAAADESSEINAITEEITLSDNFWKNLSKLLRGLKPDDKYYVNNVVYFIKNPGNRLTTPGVAVSMDAQALSSSSSPVTYRWQVSSTGGTSFSDLTDGTYYSGTTSSILTFKKPLLVDNNKMFRLSAISNGASIKYSNKATLSVVPGLSIDSYPTAQTASNGFATFSVAVLSNDGEVRYQWQKSNTKNGTYSDIPREINADLNLLVTSINQNNTYYRVIVKNDKETITTNGVKLTVLPSITITGQPLDCSTNDGTASFNVYALITSPFNTQIIPTYQWQISSNNKLYTNIANSNNQTLNLSNVTKAKDNYYYRVIITVGNIKLISSSAQLKILPTILSSFMSNNVVYTKIGNTDYANITMFVTTESTGGNVTYQWQQSKDKGTSYQNLSNTNFNQITVKNIPKNSYLNYKYRVLITNSVETIIVY